MSEWNNYSAFDKVRIYLTSMLLIMLFLSIVFGKIFDVSLMTVSKVLTNIVVLAPAFVLAILLIALFIQTLVKIYKKLTG